MKLPNGYGSVHKLSGAKEENLGELELQIDMYTTQIKVKKFRNIKHLDTMKLNSKLYRHLHHTMKILMI